VHRAAWPTSAEIDAPAPPGGQVLRVAVEVTAALRRAKSEARVGMKAAIARAVVRDTAERLAALDTVRADVCAAGNVRDLVTEVADALAVDVTFEAAGAPA
jgi:valyl-tRNA synthetase